MASNAQKLLFPLSTAALAGAVLVGSGATWTSTTETSIQVTAGSILHSNDRGDATLSITKIKPDETAEGSLTIRNDGDIPADLYLDTDTVTSAFGDDPDVGDGDASYLQLKIFRGDSATGTVVYNGDFDGVDDGTDLVEALVAEDDPATAGVADDEVTLTFQVWLRPSSPNSEQGKQASATFHFVTTETETDSGESAWDQAASWVQGE